MRSVLAGIVAMIIIAFFVGVLLYSVSSSTGEDFASPNGTVRLD